MTEINWELIDKTLDFIEQNPHKWNQSSFWSFLSDEDEKNGNLHCGTAFCFAGAAAYVSDKLEVMFSNDELDYNTITIVNHETYDDDDIENLATELLGITYEQAQAIFYYYPPTWKEDGPDAFRQYVYAVLGR